MFHHSSSHIQEVRGMNHHRGIVNMELSSSLWYCSLHLFVLLWMVSIYDMSTTTTTILAFSFHRTSVGIPYRSLNRMVSSSSNINPLEDFQEPKDDDDENHINVNDTPSNTKEVKLGIPIILNPMTSNEAELMKLEVTETVNDIVAAGMDELQLLRQQLNDDIVTSNIQRNEKSQYEMEQAQTQLLNKIDTLTENFLSSTASSRTSTKMAAQADQSRPDGQGIEIGSWGIVNGQYINTDNAAGSGLLGSSSSLSIATTATSSDTIRMMVIADPTSDPYAKLLLGPLQESLDKVLGVAGGSSSSTPKNFEMITYKPTSTIPIGNTINAVALLIFATSINDVSTLQSMIDRIYRKTLTTTSNTISIPPTQIILITTMGTTRIEKMPYSFQNLVNGNKYTKRRQMEEFIIRYVNQLQTTSSAIDYTICHLGTEIKSNTDTQQQSSFQLLPGDTIESNGIISIDTATAVLTHAIALQPYARNTTLSCSGTLPTSTTSATDPSTIVLLNDYFLKLNGPEILRIENIGPNHKLDVLTEYICEWVELLCNSGKGLTTPVRYEIVPNNNNIIQLPTGVIQQSSSIIRILFQPTNTGKYYISKEDEREIATNKNDNSKLSSSSSSNTSPSSSSRRTKEGGIEYIIEAMDNEQQQLRIRIKRCNYNYDTIIKELSEQSILSQFKKSIEVWKN